MMNKRKKEEIYYKSLLFHVYINLYHRIHELTLTLLQSVISLYTFTLNKQINALVAINNFLVHWLIFLWV